jgi:hypothetical protein
MLTIGGRKKNTSLKYRGGGPASYDNKGVEGYPRGGSANFANTPNMPPKSMQVGGMGYGYASGADSATFGGSYFPTSQICSAVVDPSRGGNNFMSGGKRSGMKRSGMKCSGGKKSKRSGSKRTRSKRTRSKRSGGTKRKWKQRGCMNGGFGLIPM